MNKEKITAVKRDNLNRIIEFKTNKNKTYNYEMAKEAINYGIIENAEVVKGEDTLLYIVEKGKTNVKDSFEKMEEFN